MPARSIASRRREGRKGVEGEGTGLRGKEGKEWWDGPGECRLPLKERYPGLLRGNELQGGHCGGRLGSPVGAYRLAGPGSVVAPCLDSFIGTERLWVGNRGGTWLTG